MNWWSCLKSDQCGINTVSTEYRQEDFMNLPIWRCQPRTEIFYLQNRCSPTELQSPPSFFDLRALCWQPCTRSSVWWGYIMNLIVSTWFEKYILFLCYICSFSMSDTVYFLLLLPWSAIVINRWRFANNLDARYIFHQTEICFFVIFYQHMAKSLLINWRGEERTREQRDVLFCH